MTPENEEMVIESLNRICDILQLMLDSHLLITNRIDNLERRLNKVGKDASHAAMMTRPIG